MNREALLARLLSVFSSVRLGKPGEIVPNAGLYNSAHVVAVYEDKIRKRSIWVLRVVRCEGGTKSSVERFLVRVYCPAGVLEQLMDTVPTGLTDGPLESLLRNAEEKVFHSVIRPFKDIWGDETTPQRFYI